MMIYRVALLIFVSLLIAGCGHKTRPPIIIEKIKPVYIYKTVPCKIPNVDCEFTGDGNLPTIKLLECIVKQKRAMESCSNTTEGNASVPFDTP